MESVTSSSKARERQGRTVRILLDPLVFLAFASLFASLVFLGDLFRQPPGRVMDVVYGPEGGRPEMPGGARAFLFFEKADINLLDMEGLVLIPGIGEVTAQKILNYMDDFGFILDLDELSWPQGPLRPGQIRILKVYAGPGRIKDSVVKSIWNMAGNQ